MTPTLDLISAAKALWRVAMPPSIEMPDDHVFFIWVSGHQFDDVELAITKSGRKMSNNIRFRITLVDKAAERYCSSILGRRAAMRRERVKSVARGSNSNDHRELSARMDSNQKAGERA
jgi:hypothetical protein